MFPPTALNVWMSAARLVDFDQDGDLDLLQSGFRAECLLENLGGRRFADVTHLLEPLLTASLVFADFDHDGDQDLLHRIRQTNDSQLSMALFRHTWAPRSATLGSSMTLELHAPPGRFVLLSASSTLATIDLGSRGIWQLDFARSVQFPSVTIPATRRRDIVLAVPSDPALRGVDLHWQAIEIDPGVVDAVRVGNRATTRFQ